MKQNNIPSLLPVATIILLAASARQQSASSRVSDPEREQRLAEQTVAAIFDGEPVMLQAEGHDFQGIFTEPEAAPERGAAIILHGRDTHPDRGQVAGLLRIALQAHGCRTCTRHQASCKYPASTTTLRGTTRNWQWPSLPG